MKFHSNMNYISGPGSNSSKCNSMAEDDHTKHNDDKQQSMSNSFENRNILFKLETIKNIFNGSEIDEGDDTISNQIYGKFEKCYWNEIDKGSFCNIENGKYDDNITNFHHSNKVKFIFK